VENITLSVAKFIQDKNLSLTFDTEAEEKIIACDPDKIERIILNLLSNAVKFTPAGVNIFVNISMKDEKIFISVKDDGIGIPNEMKDLIFERFIQIDKSALRNKEGSGIGLSLVKCLVEMQGGSVKLISEYGKGSEFILEFPDCLLPGDESPAFFNETDHYIDKINIEFSDIYQ
jgi:signal transduction histidine kinase